MIKNKNMAVLGIIKTITLKKTSKIDWDLKKLERGQHLSKTFKQLHVSFLTFFSLIFFILTFF
jgi:hypothetical protein